MPYRGSNNLITNASIVADFKKWQVCLKLIFVRFQFFLQSLCFSASLVLRQKTIITLFYNVLHYSVCFQGHLPPYTGSTEMVSGRIRNLLIESPIDALYINIFKIIIEISAYTSWNIWHTVYQELKNTRHLCYRNFTCLLP